MQIRRLSILFCGIFFLLYAVIGTARTNINFDVSIGAAAPLPPPPTYMVMAPPQGYSNCYMTQGMWLNNVWVPSHQECTYAAPAGPSLWVSGYWGCVAVGPDGSCGHWNWYAPRWNRGHPLGYRQYGENRSFHHHHHG